MQSNVSIGTSGPTEPLAQAGLQERTLLPGSPEFIARNDSYWCNSARLSPACIIQPLSATEISRVVVALVNAKQKFAIRGGGYSNGAASNNITGGITIDLGLLDATHYDPTTGLAHLQPGSSWNNVYAELEKHGRTVAGARSAEVGVGGFLLGGGGNFYTSRLGFSCDNVVAYEVVLADGRVVTVESEGPFTDLFRALKGGGNNFGIVTRFTMPTFPSGPVWGGVVLRSLDTFLAAADALVDFTKRCGDEPDTNMQMVVAHQPRFGGDVVIHICNNMAATERPAALEATLALPETMNNIKTTTLQEVLTYSSLPHGYHNIWYTTSFKNDASIMIKAAELHKQLVEELHTAIADQDFASHVAFQPLSAAIIHASRRTNPGGNVLGLEQDLQDRIMIQASVSVRTPELAKWAEPKVRYVVDQVQALAEALDGSRSKPWLYLNYAHPSQEVLQSYGPENVTLIREVAAKYDPGAVFQHLCPGGFKISSVGP